MNHVPISVAFAGEQGMDFGGLARDFFSGFWEAAYTRMFDGAALLAPACRAVSNANQFSILGGILSRGYLCCQFLPTRVIFPVLASVLLGLSTDISQDIMLDSFLESLSPVDRETIARALKSEQFTSSDTKHIVNIVFRFGCRDMPTPANLKQLLCNVARHQFKSQPFEAISTMCNGVPDKHKEVLENKDC